MQLRLDDPGFLPDLLDFLERARIAAKAGRSGRVLLEPPHTDDSQGAQTLLELIVTGWEAMNPTAGVSFVGPRSGLARSGTRQLRGVP